MIHVQVWEYNVVQTASSMVIGVFDVYILLYDYVEQFFCVGPSPRPNYGTMWRGGLLLASKGVASVNS